jgi:hypothetical protein
VCVAFSGLPRGRLAKNRDTPVGVGCRSRPRSLCIISIMSVRCNEKPLRPGREG